MGDQETSFGTISISRLSEVLNNLTAPLDRITKLIRQRHKSIQDGKCFQLTIFHSWVGIIASLWFLVGITVTYTYIYTYIYDVL